MYELCFSSGMIGSIVFAYYQSSSLDAHCKQWRLFADILNDISLTLAIVSPLFTPTLFVLLSCLSSLFFALVGVAGETTRAALRYLSYFTTITNKLFFNPKNIIFKNNNKLFVSNLKNFIFKDNK